MFTYPLGVPIYLNITLVGISYWTVCVFIHKFCFCPFYSFLPIFFLCLSLSFLPSFSHAFLFLFFFLFFCVNLLFSFSLSFSLFFLILSFPLCPSHTVLPYISLSFDRIFLCGSNVCYHILQFYIFIQDYELFLIGM
jgi:hypothetical protein